MNIRRENQKTGNKIYSNKVNGLDYKQIALILFDLDKYGLPITKAIKHFLLMNKSDWEATLGI